MHGQNHIRFDPLTFGLIVRLVFLCSFVPSLFLRPSIHSYFPVFTCTFILPCIHVYIHTSLYSRVHSYFPVFTCTFILPCIHVYIHTTLYSRVHSYFPVFTCTFILPCIHVYIHPYVLVCVQLDAPVITVKAALCLATVGHGTALLDCTESHFRSPCPHSTKLLLQFYQLL
jgi:hypothetical protein